MKLASRIIMGILLLIIGVLAFIYFAPGYSMYFVRSGSMTPVLNIGDLVITGPVNGIFTSSIAQGTIITYTHRLGDEVTHRVISINADQTFTTKGDSSESPDQYPVNLSQVKGIYMMKIPYIGYLTSFIRTKLGWYIAIIVPTLVLVGFIVKDIVKEALKK